MSYQNGKRMVIAGMLLIAGLISVLLFVPARQAEERNPHRSNQFTNMRLISPAFKNGETIPAKYTCDGENVSPPFQISDVPAAAKSLVLVVDDPDAPAHTFVHWIVWNLDPKTTEIREGVDVPESHLGRTSFGTPSYGGPCPPSGTHRYFFKLYALDASFPPPPEPFPTKEQLERAMRDYILDKTELIGMYRRGE